MAGSRPKAAETALSVERPYQNQGIGTGLLRRLIALARNRSIRLLHMLCLLENGKVLRIARKLGARLTYGQGQVVGRLALPWPDHLTLLLELLDDASAMLAILHPLNQSPHREVVPGATSERDDVADAAIPLAGGRRRTGKATRVYPPSMAS